MKYILFSDDCSPIPSLRMSCTRMLESPGSISQGRYTHIWNAGLAACALCEGDIAEAENLYTSLQVELLDSGHLIVGILAWKLGRLHDAVDHLSTALDYKFVNSVWARLKLGKALLERDEPGDKDAALNHIRKVQEIALESHIVPIGERAQAILVQQEGIHPPNATQLPADLTPREVEVIRLLGNGALNKEIADALSISIRTVHRHVANILRKTGCGNRTEAARFAARAGLLQDDRGYS